MRSPFETSIAKLLSSVCYFDKRQNAILIRPIVIDASFRDNSPFQGLSYTNFAPALRHWKPQNISFLDLPGEIRNQIYHLLIRDSNNQYVEPCRPRPRASETPLPVLLMQICKQVREELLPLYLQTIDLRLQVHGQENLLSSSGTLPLPASQMLEWFNQHDLSSTDHFHCMTLENKEPNFFCRLLVTDSKEVFVQLYLFIHGVSSTAVTYVSIAIRDEIIDSLKTSPTGLLGFRHFAIANYEINLLLQWYDWKKQEFKWQSTKTQEAPCGTYKHPTVCYGYRCYECYLITQAEMEGLPRMIPAVSFENLGQHIRQRLSWKRDEETWRRRKAMEAGRAYSEELMWSYEHYLIEQAEKESMPRLIRAATSPLDELEMDE